MMNEKPIRPAESDCCGSGCKPCIFDIYEERLKKWESRKGSFVESKALNQIKYLPFVIISIEDLLSLKIFQFQAVTLKRDIPNKILINNATLGLEYDILQELLKIKSGEYLIMKGNYENEIISRSYTPVLNKDSFEKGIFTVIISLQANGKMTHFFKRLKTNDIVFWRGPYQELKLDFKLFKHILLFGGGTGVVPLYNIAKAIVEDEEYETWVSLHASFKTTNSIILRDEFGRLRDFWNFKMNIYITNQNGSDFKPSYNESIIFKKITETLIDREIKKCGEDKFFVTICGPEGFNHFVGNCFKKFGVEDENIFIFWYFDPFFPLSGNLFLKLPL